MDHVLAIRILGSFLPLLVSFFHISQTVAYLILWSITWVTSQMLCSVGGKEGGERRGEGSEGMIVFTAGR